MKTLTDKQAARLAKIEAKLPEGWEYNLHNADANHFNCLPVWGVSLYKDGNHVGYVSKSMDANCTAGREDTELQKLLLNRVAAALWHKQPRWS